MVGASTAVWNFSFGPYGETGFDLVAIVFGAAFIVLAALLIATARQPRKAPSDLTWAFKPGPPVARPAKARRPAGPIDPKQERTVSSSERTIGLTAALLRRPKRPIAPARQALRRVGQVPPAGVRRPPRHPAPGLTAFVARRRRPPPKRSVPAALGE